VTAAVTCEICGCLADWLDDRDDFGRDAMTTEEFASMADREVRLSRRRLSPYARQQRLAMLIVSAVTLAVSWGGFRPSEIDALGIKVSQLQENALLIFLAFVLTWLVGNFATIAKPEFLTLVAEVWRYSVETERLVGEANRMMGEGLRRAEVAINQHVNELSPDLVKQFAAAAEETKRLATGTVSSRLLKEWTGMYKSRIHFEYRFPLWIASSVLVLAIARIAILGYR
jgi:uncharacterized membrane protein YwzB